MKCPNCGSQSDGAFCAECGAPLKGAKCRECKASLAAGAKFCTQCGTPASGSRDRASNAPWFVAVGALVLLLLVIMWPRISGKSETAADDGRMPITQMQDAPNTGSGMPGPLTGTPREQADRLFNRVMTERAEGDTAQMTQFLPMAIQAYEIAGDLDADGFYHLSLLQALAGDYKSARASAERILAESPTHLLGLSAAAQAARSEGDDAAARRYYQRFLAAYDSESKLSKPEYQDHSRMFEELRTEAENFGAARR